MRTRLLFIHALSPLHAGTGQSEGAIELAIARDRATSFPYLPGSSLKGSLRDRAQTEQGDAPTRSLFGPPTELAKEHAGALIVGDANLLLLPVRSIAGTFAWVTSPYLLRRFVRDAQEAGMTGHDLAPVPTPAATACDVTSVSTLRVDTKVIFEDLDLEPSNDPRAGEWAKVLGRLLFPAEDESDWRRMLEERFCVVHDDVMTFLSQHATDVVARVALNSDSKTVRKGGLWHEESLPVETVLVSLLAFCPNERTNLTTDQFTQVTRALVKRPLQLGGKATVGRGRCRLVLSGKED